MGRGCPCDDDPKKRQATGVCRWRWSFEFFLADCAWHLRKSEPDMRASGLPALVVQALWKIARFSMTNAGVLKILDKFHS
jgi:hypothetical protein